MMDINMILKLDSNSKTGLGVRSRELEKTGEEDPLLSPGIAVVSWLRTWLKTWLLELTDSPFFPC